MTSTANTTCSAAGRRIQYRLASLLAAMTALTAAIGGSGLVFSTVLQNSTSREISLNVALYLSPLWLPVVFLCYAAGRRRLSPALLLAFSVVEIAATVLIAVLTR